MFVPAISLESGGAVIPTFVGGLDIALPATKLSYERRKKARLEECVLSRRNLRARSSLEEGHMFSDGGGC